jgi:hypothetical protein
MYVCVTTSDVPDSSYATARTGVVPLILMGEEYVAPFCAVGVDPSVV